MAPERRLEPLRTLRGRGALVLASGLKYDVGYRVQTFQHLVDGAPGTQVWMVELTFDELPEGGVVELLRLYSSDDTALLEMGEERPPWQVELRLRDAPPIPWRRGAALRFALAGQPPAHLVEG